MKKFVLTAVLFSFLFAGITFGQETTTSLATTSIATTTDGTSGIGKDVSSVNKETEAKIKALRAEMDRRIKEIRAEYEAKIKALKDNAKAKILEIKAQKKKKVPSSQDVSPDKRGKKIIKGGWLLKFFGQE